MSTRNIMNERNTDNKPVGKTRKSAASAKPVSQAASSVYVKDVSSKPKKKNFLQNMFNRNHEDETPKERKAREAAEARKAAEKEEAKAKRNFKPQTAEYKKWKIVFWAFIAVSVAIMIPVTLVTSLFETNYPLYVTLLILAWGFLTAAIITDIRKVKPARDEAYYAEAAVRNKNGKKKKK